MIFEFLLPLLGGGITSALSLKKRQADKTNLVFVNDEIPITNISDDLVETMTDVRFKVVCLQSRCIARKRLNELEKDLNKLHSFFQRLSEFDIEMRVYTQCFEQPQPSKKECGNAFLDELTKRWNNQLSKTFSITHYFAIQETKSAEEIDKVIKEVLSLLSDFTNNFIE